VKFSKHENILMSLESTAMADIIFLLLIFFLLSSSFILQIGTQVNLPRESRPEPLDQRHLIISLEKSGEVFLNDQRITMGELESEVGALLEADPERAVIVRGDQSIALGRVIEVMDVAKRMGAKKLAIATQPKGS
jgi:biopolymer transport protein ExbD